MQILFKCPTPDKTHVLLTFDKVHNPLRLPRETTCERPISVNFLHFWLRNALHATTARTFLTCRLPKAVQHRGVLYILTWKCASRSNVVHFSTSQRPKVLRPWFCTFWLGHLCFAQSLIWPDGSAPAALASLLFDPPESQTIGKTQRFATLLPFCAPASSVLCLFLFSDLLSSSLLFSSLTLRTSAFSSVHNIVGSLTSKLPSTRQDLEIAAVSFSLHALTGASGELLRLVLDQITQASWEILRPWLNLECVECVFVSSRALVIKMVYRSSCGCVETCRDSQILQHRAQRHSLWPAWPHEPFWNFKFLATCGI